MLGPDQLNRLNPWWTDPGWSPTDDLHLAAAEAARFRWDPRPFDEEDLGSGAVFTLRGPRQSGKTTLTKRLIADRVAAGFGRRTCFLTLQTIATAAELQTAIEFVLPLWPDEPEPWLFVLDELTFVPRWATVVAHLREHDRAFRAATVILTGSSAVDLAESADLLHGRRGRSARPLDRLHLPLSFRDYAVARMPGIDAPKLGIDGLLGAEGREALRLASLATARLDQVLGEYLRCGGMPAAVDDMLTDGQLRPGTVTELWRGLSADVRRLERSELTLQKLLSRVAVSLGSLVNWSDLARELGVSNPTASSYVDLLAKSFALLVVYQQDRKRQGGPALARSRKVYFGDLGFAAIPESLGGPRPSEAALVENALAIALFRQAERDALERFAVPLSLFVWRSAADREIDFVIDGAPPLPIESKYADRPSGKDYESLAKAFGRGVMVSRLAIDVDRAILTVPAGVLLFVLG